METWEGCLPYHGCVVFVKTQIDTLNRSGQETGIEAEKRAVEAQEREPSFLQGRL